MGIDSDRVISEDIDNGLICSVCTEVLDKPVMVDICEHTYCTDCINHWLQFNKTCPQDRIVICTKQLVSIPRYMRNQLNKIQVKCKHYLKGCSYETTLESIESHEKTCSFDEINTRISRRVDSEFQLYTQFKRTEKHRHKYEYEVIRFSMSEERKKAAIKLSKEALYLCGRVNFGQIAAYIKTHLEPEYNRYWHCIVGTDFDCLLTANNSFITISIDGIFIIAFKTK